jgi:hypothetical protein
VAYCPDTQDRSQNQVTDADDVRKSVQPTSKERVDWKKPDIRNQQGDKQTLEIAAIKKTRDFMMNLSLVIKWNDSNSGTMMGTDKGRMLTAPFTEITSLKGDQTKIRRDS